MKERTKETVAAIGVGILWGLGQRLYRLVRRRRREREQRERESTPPEEVRRCD